MESLILSPRSNLTHHIPYQWIEREDHRFGSPWQGLFQETYSWPIKQVRWHFDAKRILEEVSQNTWCFQREAALPLKDRAGLGRRKSDLRVYLNKCGLFTHIYTWKIVGKTDCALIIFLSPVFCNVLDTEYFYTKYLIVELILWPKISTFRSNIQLFV